MRCQMKTKVSTMPDMTVFVAIKEISQWCMIPLTAVIGFFFKKVLTLEVRASVLEARMDNIKEDITEIKLGVSKLVDRDRNGGRRHG